MKQLAINGGAKMVKKNFAWPVFDERDVNAVTDIAKSGQWANPDCKGYVEQFEKEFAAYCGSRYAVTCVNGSVAIRLALIASGVRPGDEVIVPPYTFIATASTVLECNCVPVFVDIHPDTYNLDPSKIAAAITPRTKAIIPVHFAGQACDMDAIMAIAERFKLTVIEDAAHAHGGAYKDRKLGSIGHAGCFSFQSSKNLNAGEGGIVVTNDERLYDMMNSLRNVGRVKGGQWYEHHNLGCNYRITQFQAALLLQQLKRLDEQTRTRDENGKYLASRLSTIPGITPLTRGHGETAHTHHLFIFKYDKSQFGGLSKKQFAEALAAEGVPAFMGYPKPLYEQPLFRDKNFLCYAIPDHVDYTNVRCPVAERACSEEAVWILQHAMLGTRQDMDSFAEAVAKIYQASK
ncbi:DegT/DnrJ/EryC1/StrS family aminotransferase [Fulvivirgaceae bacterium PWU4]|uniref:DegT/DnrJ/EryC1/StrS family aminotransferase n=1 Tax=Chryseosolibacter histidini TaxID=2782349 RepID=A0AAP2DM83_9BACT|nr:DegT/DnrJ/EryC1/StrS family aminotransferase [Chryseosolibacter histidini]MBT1698861.1 DegT/DnrJ/EryC1/StrS family aminotransferase [Chryseosolibacter histidini]